MFCVVLISFYNKMTIKQQNDARYGSNNSIIFLHLTLYLIEVPFTAIANREEPDQTALIRAA